MPLTVGLILCLLKILSNEDFYYSNLIFPTLALCSQPDLLSLTCSLEPFCLVLSFPQSCPVQHGSHQPYVATDHLKWDKSKMRLAVRVKCTVDCKDLAWKKYSISSIIFVLVEMTIFCTFGVKWNTSLKLFSPVFSHLVNAATRRRA